MPDPTNSIVADAIARQISNLSRDVKKLILHNLDMNGELAEIRRNAVVNWETQRRQQVAQIEALTLQIQQLESQIQQLQEKLASAKRRLTPAEKKARIIALRREEYKPTEIAKEMTADGEPITAGNVRVILHRVKKPKKPKKKSKK